MAERASLETERLLLRPYTRNDVEAVARVMGDIESEYYYEPMPYPPTREQVERYLGRRIEESWEARAIFAVELGGQVIGETCLLDVDARNGNAELGYVIRKDLWGRGLAFEAARATVAWGFGAFELTKIWAQAQACNLRSIRIMERLGMTREGILRRQLRFRGKQVDLVFYGLLRDEWPEVPLRGGGWTDA